MVIKIECVIDGCTKHMKYKKSGLCQTHYVSQWTKLDASPPTDEYKENFRGSLKHKIRIYSVRDEQTGCWNWQGARNTRGYGIVGNGDKTVKAHRASYEVYVAPLTDGTVVHHKCANASCVNPKHLQAITSIENIAEMLERKFYKDKIKELEAKLEKCICEGRHNE